MCRSLRVHVHQVDIVRVIDLRQQELQPTDVLARAQDKERKTRLPHAIRLAAELTGDSVLRGRRCCQGRGSIAPEAIAGQPTANGIATPEDAQGKGNQDPRNDRHPPETLDKGSHRRLVSEAPTRLSLAVKLCSAERRKRHTSSHILLSLEEEFHYKIAKYWRRSFIGNSKDREDVQFLFFADRRITI